MTYNGSVKFHFTFTSEKTVLSFSTVQFRNYSKLLQESFLLGQTNENHLYVLAKAKEFERVVADFRRKKPCEFLSLPIDVLLSTAA